MSTSDKNVCKIKAKYIFQGCLADENLLELLNAGPGGGDKGAEGEATAMP